jgi:hypothetical protein
MHRGPITALGFRLQAQGSETRNWRPIALDDLVDRALEVHVVAILPTFSSCMELNCDSHARACVCVCVPLCRQADEKARTREAEQRRAPPPTTSTKPSGVGYDIRQSF